MRFRSFVLIVAPLMFAACAGVSSPTSPSPTLGAAPLGRLAELTDAPLCSIYEKQGPAKPVLNPHDSTIDVTVEANPNAAIYETRWQRDYNGTWVTGGPTSIETSPYGGFRPGSTGSYRASSRWISSPPANCASAWSDWSESTSIDVASDVELKNQKKKSFNYPPKV